MRPERCSACRRAPNSTPIKRLPRAPVHVKTPQVHSTRAMQRGVLVLALGLAAACSSSSDSEGTDVALGTAVQDLVEDRDGTTVVLTIPDLAASVTAASVEANGGQTALSVSASGDEVAVVFDQRVTPSHQVRVVGVEGISADWRAVSTTDPRVPQMSLLSATQDVSDNDLGGDQIVLAFIAGPRVVESQVEDISNWTLRVEGVELDLAGTTIVHDPTTQVATFTLGQLANLHANFTLEGNVQSVADADLSSAPFAGAATGDTVAPTLDGGSPVAQDINVVTGDEFGRVLFVDFSEPISPVFGATAANFSVVDHGDAQGLTAISRVAVDPADNSRVRVSFTRPVVPGLDQLSIGGVLDAHGNAFTAQTSAIAAGTTVANGFDSISFNTVEGASNDQVVAVLTQAIDPDTAEDPARWTLDIDSNPVTLADQELSYDLATRTVTIDLDFDAVNGTTADLASNGVVDVDGDVFAVAAPQATAAGDSTAPLVTSIVQNRNADISGRSIDVVFSEELDVTTATDAANYTFAPAVTVQTATILSGATVRLTLQDPVTPGDHTLTVLQAVSDPAGNDLGGDVGPGALTSTDSVPPSLVSGSALAVEGAENDVFFAFFNDTLVQSEAEDITRWSVEAPAGNAFDLTGSTVSYDSSTGIATLTLNGSGVSGFTVGGDFTVTLTNVRDIGGNAAASMDATGVATGERNLPALDGIFGTAVANELSVRFDEPMGSLDSLYDAVNNPLGVRFEVTDPTTMQVSLPVSATVVDRGLGVVLTYAAAIDPAATVNVIGARDLAGNSFFPVIDQPITPVDATFPDTLGTVPTFTAVQGVDNDQIVVIFDAPLASWKVTDPAHYSLFDVDAGAAVDLTGAKFEFDGDRTVTITLGTASGADAVAAHQYDLTINVVAGDPIRSIQGVALAGASTSSGINVDGDNADGPAQAGTVAFTDPSDPNAVFVVFDETVDPTAAATAAAYDYNTGTFATSAVLVDDRAVRLVFPSAVTAGGTLDVSAAAAIDTAGNVAAATLSLAVVQDTTAPFVVTSGSAIQNGLGGDLITLTFDEVLETSAGLAAEDFVVEVGGVPQRVGAVLWESQTLTATLLVQDMADGQIADVTISNVSDLAGNQPAAPLVVNVVITGDSTAPAIVTAFVNDAVGQAGQTVDVLFSEDVLSAFVLAGGNWTLSDGETVTFAEMMETNAVRLTLSGELDAGATLTLAAGLEDYAGNQETNALVVTPVR